MGESTFEMTVTDVVPNLVAAIQFYYVSHWSCKQYL